MAKKTVKDSVSPTDAIKLIGGERKLQILRALSNGTKRFSDLRRELPDITQKMLTTELRDLEKNHIIKRKVYAVVPPKVEYSLSVHGKELKPLIKMIVRWGEYYVKSRTKKTDLKNIESKAPEQLTVFEEKEK